jgi:hypothetical protein
MNSRHNSLGIKQVVRLEWMQQTVNYLLSGLSKNEIRQELKGYLSERRGSGTIHTRGEVSRNQIVNILMNIWITPKNELLDFRNICLRILRLPESPAILPHWCMIAATYPFWSNVAKQVGRLLSLQDSARQDQVFARMKELYGDRETVVRFSRYVIRSFVAWGVLSDTSIRGCYRKNISQSIVNKELALLLIEANLHALEDGRGNLSLLVNSPSNFPFIFPHIGSDLLNTQLDRIHISNSSSDDPFLYLDKP